MAKDRARILINTLKKIPLFHGLSPTQIQTILGACQPQRYEAGRTLCARGTAAEEMYILLSGQLGVVAEDGTMVAMLSPVTTVGEMGIVTRQERRATVDTIDACNVLVVRRAAFDGALKSDPLAEARVYRNIVNILADKIVQDNVRMRDYLVEKVKHEEQLREYRRRSEIAVDIAASESGIPASEIETQVDEQLIESRELRVLIVDDEPDIRRVLSQALADYDTVEARDGEEAMAEIDEDPPDLVITDIRMPGMDGYTLMSKLKERHPQTPVLAISGYVSDRDVNEYGFDGFMEKPMNLKDFRGLVDAALENAN
jgi:CheY-like chemotaxis protein/CRP-like cAMP-binding protein